MIKVMLVDDHPVVRWGFRQIVSELAPDIELEAEAGSDAEALRLLASRSIDVMVLDIGLGGRSGMELLERVSAERPPIKVLLYSRYPEQDFALRGFKCGASGYINKEESPDEIVRAIREVAAGGTYVSRAAAAILKAAVSDVSRSAPHEALSRREFEVFGLLVRGQSVTEIGRQLHLSVKTISTHRTNILGKMNAHSTADLVRYAIEHKLGD